jgi:hypothetical protein
MQIQQSTSHSEIRNSFYCLLRGGSHKQKRLFGKFSKQKFSKKVSFFWVTQAKTTRFGKFLIRFFFLLTYRRNFLVFCDTISFLLKTRFLVKWEISNQVQYGIYFKSLLHIWKNALKKKLRSL